MSEEYWQYFVCVDIGNESHFADYDKTACGIPAKYPDYLYKHMTEHKVTCPKCIELYEEYMRKVEAEAPDLVFVFDWEPCVDGDLKPSINGGGVVYVKLAVIEELGYYDSLQIRRLLEAVGYMKPRW